MVSRHDHQSQVHDIHQIEAPQYIAKTTQEPLCECPWVGHPQPSLNPVLWWDLEMAVHQTGDCGRWCFYQVWSLSNANQPTRWRSLHFSLYHIYFEWLNSPCDPTNWARHGTYRATTVWPLRPVDVKNLAASREQPVSALANPRGGYKATLPVMLHCQADQDL